MLRLLSGMLHVDEDLQQILSGGFPFLPGMSRSLFGMTEVETILLRIRRGLLQPGAA